MKGKPIKIKTIYSAADQLTMEFEFNPNQNYVAHINFMFPVVTKLFISLLEFELGIKKIDAYKISFVILKKLYLAWHRIVRSKPIKITYIKGSNELYLTQGEYPEKQRLYFRLKIREECPRSLPHYKENYEHLRNFNFMDSVGTIAKKKEKPWRRFQEVHFELPAN